MNGKVVNEILGYLNNIGRAISSGAKESFAIIVKQQISIGIVDSFMCLVVIVVLSLLISKFVKMYKNYEYKKYEAEDMSGFIIAGIVVASLLDFLTLFCLTRSVLHILNPAFFAIQYILETITGNN